MAFPLLALCSGDEAPVCERKGKEFNCMTADSSINGTCDASRCPLEGTPVAPKIVEPQLAGLNFSSIGHHIAYSIYVIHNVTLSLF